MRCLKSHLHFYGLYSLTLYLEADAKFHRQFRIISSLSPPSSCPRKENNSFGNFLLHILLKLWIWALKWLRFAPALVKLRKGKNGGLFPGIRGEMFAGDRCFFLLSLTKAFLRIVEIIITSPGMAVVVPIHENRRPSHLSGCSSVNGTTAAESTDA